MNVKTAAKSFYQGMLYTLVSAPLPGLPNTTSPFGSFPFSKVITILNRVSDCPRPPPVGSEEQHIACGALSVSENTRLRSRAASTTSPRRAGPTSCAIPPQRARAISRRKSEPDSQGGSSTSLFSRK